MIELHNAPPVYEKLIHYNEEKHERVYLTVNSFRNTEYLHIRKYYLDFDEEWKPTKDGIAIPIDFNNSKALFEGLVEAVMNMVGSFCSIIAANEVDDMR